MRAETALPRTELQAGGQAVGRRRHWGSRIRYRVLRAFTANDGQDLTTGALVRFIWPRRQKFSSRLYQRARAAARFFADEVGRGTGRGQPILWRLRPDPPPR